MKLTSSEYIHGYAQEEQRRLIAQAEYWKDSLLLQGLSYAPGERVLEIGCGAGANLAIFARAFPGITVAGIDIEPLQIDFARRHLQTSGVDDADLQVGDASRLPWADCAYDHVFIMWLLEHLRDAKPVLREAYRVLRPGGRIVVTETDYTSFRVDPESSDCRYLLDAYYSHYDLHGNAIAGRQLGPLLTQSAFKNVTNAPYAFHYFAGPDDSLRRHIEYTSAYLEPALGQMARALERDEERLLRGLKDFRAIRWSASGSFTQTNYRAVGSKT